MQAELFPTDERAYSLLVGHNRTNGTYKTTEQLHAEYVELTDELVRQITDGVSVKDSITGEWAKRTPDYVVWLDKSARPVEWLTRDLWDTLAVDLETGDIPMMPKSRFVNIDREQWVNTVDPLGIGRMDIDLVDISIVRSLRSIFIEPKYKQHIDESIDSSPSELDGKTILIVDEVKSTGRTLDIAQKFFERAFPTSVVATAHWMKGVVTLGDRRSGQAQGNADLPVWYKEHTEFGRGVGNRYEDHSRMSRSRTQRLGGWFLSTALPKIKIEQDVPGIGTVIKEVIDPASVQLRKELHWLADDVREGGMLVVPSVQRDDYEKRVKAYNHGMTLTEFVNKRKALVSAIK